MRKKLPIGIQTFSEVRDEAYLYVDKTEHIHRLLNSGKYFFLSRPRRFGKSMTVSTIKEIYRGNKALFDGLWIENQWNWDKTSPVIHLQFNKLGYHSRTLENALISYVKDAAEENGLTIQSTVFDEAFEELISKLHARDGKVVLLIDEYDKPINDFLEKDQLYRAYEHRKILAEFYGVIKPLDEKIRFFFMTGVSKFSQVNLFSKLNILEDITLSEDFSVLTGYTQEEVEANFSEWLNYAHKRFGTMPREEFMNHIKTWYNGYSWDGETRVYNPISLMTFLKTRQFQDFWFKTGTPTFLIDILKEKKVFKLGNLKLSQRVFDTYDLESLELRSLLFQTGYLTIKSVDWMENSVELGYPNKEVEMALTEHIIGAMLGRSPLDTKRPVEELREAFLDNDIQRTITIINSLLKDVPSHLIEKQDEKFYHALVHLHFNYLGMIMDSEVHTSDGRMDAVVQTPTHIFIYEFKLNQSAKVALKQIKEKKYADKFASNGKITTGVGVNFDMEKRAIDDWGFELL